MFVSVDDGGCLPAICLSTTTVPFLFLELDALCICHTGTVSKILRSVNNLLFNLILTATVFVWGQQKLWDEVGEVSYWRIEEGDYALSLSFLPGVEASEGSSYLHSSVFG